MTAAEKTDLFNFLAAADDWMDGIKTVHQVPVFTDSPDATEVAEKMIFSSMEGLEHAVRTCTRCPLCRNRTAAVPGEGPRAGENIPVLVIGYAPGEADDRSGRPFTGNGGELLDKMLAAIKLTRAGNCYLTSLVKCRPPRDEAPSDSDVFVCSSYIAAQIELLRPRLILAVGEEASAGLLRTDEGLERLRGAFFDYHGIPLLCTFHPDDILSDESLKRPAWEDLKLFRQELDRIWHDGSK